MSDSKETKQESHVALTTRFKNLSIAKNQSSGSLRQRVFQSLADSKEKREGYMNRVRAEVAANGEGDNITVSVRKYRLEVYFEPMQYPKSMIPKESTEEGIMRQETSIETSFLKFNALETSLGNDIKKYNKLSAKSFGKRDVLHRSKDQFSKSLINQKIREQAKKVGVLRSLGYTMDEIQQKGLLEPPSVDGNNIFGKRKARKTKRISEDEDGEDLDKTKEKDEKEIARIKNSDYDFQDSFVMDDRNTALPPSSSMSSSSIPSVPIQQQPVDPKPQNMIDMSDEPKEDRGSPSSNAGSSSL